MMIRILLILLLLYLAYLAVRMLMVKFGRSSQWGPGKELGKIDDIMIKDPYCQVYFPKKDGVHLREDGKDLYFCSTDCRDKYIEQKGNG
ncbi:MAG: hypothetical protein R6U50_12225 [Desulfobacterales bacterium]